MSTTPSPPPGASARPRWKRVLLWLGVAFLALNVLPFIWFYVVRTVSHPIVVFLAVFGVVLAMSARYGSLQLLRTASNPASADFTRHDDAGSGGYRYEVRPARASWLAVLVPLPLCALLATWGVYAGWMVYAATALYLLVAGIFVLPGARERKPVTITVSPEGLRTGDLHVPLARIADLEVELRGVKLSEDPLMPGPNGVPVSSMLGRGLGRRQASRSLALTLRVDGQSQAHVIAGGLTPDCARNLLRDIEQAIARFGGSHAGAAAA